MIAPGPPDTAPNDPAIFIARKWQRIEAECLKRIQARFPVAIQLQIIVSLLAETAGYSASDKIVGASSEKYLIAKDRQAARRLAECMLKHRQAAEALAAYVSENVARIHSIDVSADQYWPPAAKGEHG